MNGFFSHLTRMDFKNYTFQVFIFSATAKTLFENVSAWFEHIYSRVLLEVMNTLLNIFFINTLF